MDELRVELVKRRDHYWGDVDRVHIWSEIEGDKHLSRCKILRRRGFSVKGYNKKLRVSDTTAEIEIDCPRVHISNALPPQNQAWNI